MCLVLVLVVLAFTSAMNGGAVYDDQVQVMRNPTLRDAANIPKSFTQSVWQFSDEASEKPIGSFYRPLFNVGLILNFRVFGLNLVGWHLFSLFLHLVATVLVFLLSKQLGLSSHGSQIAALLFGIHPLHVEPVAWISSFPDPLVAVFILASILLYERYYQEEAGTLHLLLSSILFSLLAMFTKEIAVALPVYLAFREWLGRSTNKSFAVVAVRILKRVAPFAAAALIYLVARYSVLGFISQNDPRAAGITVKATILTIPSILLSYVRMLFLPFPLSFVYEHEYVQSVTDFRFWGAVLAMLLVMAIAVRLVWYSLVARRALLLLVIFVLPVLNIRAFNPFESLLHDRYLYLPLAGFCILVGMGVTWLYARLGETRRRVLIGAGVLVFVLFFGLTWNQNRSWKSDVALAENAVRRQPGQAYGLNHLGRAYAAQTQLPAAEDMLRKAVELKPASYDFQADLGYVYTREKKYSQAVDSYQKAIALGIDYPFTFFNLGVTYIGLGNLAEAEAAFRRAVDLKPGYAEALYNIGWISEQRGQVDMAEKSYRESLEKNPGYVDSYVGLARLYATQQRYQEAVRELQTALGYQSNNADVLFALGGLYLRANLCRDAIPLLERLAQRNPQYPGGLTSLGLGYECAGDLERAKATYQQAIRIVPQAVNTRVAREHLERLGARPLP